MVDTDPDIEVHHRKQTGIQGQIEDIVDRPVVPLIIEVIEAQVFDIQSLRVQSDLEGGARRIDVPVQSATQIRITDAGGELCDFDIVIQIKADPGIQLVVLRIWQVLAGQRLQVVQIRAFDMDTVRTLVPHGQIGDVALDTQRQATDLA